MGVRSMTSDRPASIAGVVSDPTLADRFWEKVAKSNPESCWNWSGSVSPLGYGRIKVGGKKGAAVPAHRVSAVLCGLLQDDTAHVLHSCDNRLCCNPEHLFIGSHQQNMADMADKKRNRTPRPGNGRQKLSDADRTEIMRLVKQGINKSDVSRRFNVTPTRIRQIAQEAT
jgi:hypothetical protein